MVGFRLLRPLYNLLFFIILPFILPYYYFRKPAEIRKRWLKERFGFINSNRTKENPPKERIWLHAVSVGEAIAARPLMSLLLKETELFVTTVTDTGQKVAREFLKDKAEVLFAPFDLSFSVKRFISTIKPNLIIIMETELWPNLFYIASQKGIPIVVVNGRISESSFRGYKRIGFFMRGMLSKGTLYCMQTDIDAKRLISIGAPKKKVKITGNLKMDVRPSDKVPGWCKHLRRPVIVAGSTHKGEEDIILETFKRLKEDFPEATLILAPRHPERFQEVERLLKDSKLRFSKKTEGVRTDSSVVLLDTIGELTSVYGSADVCIIGGSFIPHGGHNLFEAASWAKPIICGPSMENFPLAEEFFRSRAAIKTDARNLYRVLLKILKDRRLSTEMSKKALMLFREHQGAVTKTYGLLMKILKGK
jgi:3-deoxy-D-manno-octulosonic-acid transferase